MDSPELDHRRFRYASKAEVLEKSARYLSPGAGLCDRFPDVLAGLRQQATVRGVEFRHPDGAVAASRGLYDTGVRAIFSSLDRRVLQFKPAC